jgi:hypothetical protein
MVVKEVGRVPVRWVWLCCRGRSVSGCRGLARPDGLFTEIPEYLVQTCPYGTDHPTPICPNDTDGGQRGGAGPGPMGVVVL